LHHVNVVPFGAKLSLNCVRCANLLVRHMCCVGRAVGEFRPKSFFLDEARGENTALLELNKANKLSNRVWLCS
jgi:hypothetical protein